MFYSDILSDASFVSNATCKLGLRDLSPSLLSLHKLGSQYHGCEMYHQVISGSEYTIVEQEKQSKECGARKLRRRD